MSSGMNEKELLKQLGKLPREIRPDNDPWLGISSRLDQLDRNAESGFRFGAWPLRAVASIAVAALAAVIVFQNEPGAPAQPVNHNVAQETTANPAQPRFMVSSEVEYLVAFREFIPVGESRNQLPVKAVETIELGWADMLQAENALSTALSQNPDNPFLNQKMLELRARQLSFLRQLAVLDHSNRRLTI